MYFSDRIELLEVSYTENIFGDIIEKHTTTEAFADRKSIRQSEFYQAAATGLRPELMFVVWSEEYAGQEKLRYGGKEYNIIRAYDKGEFTELVCQGLVNR